MPELTLADTQFMFHVEEFKTLREEISRLDNAKRNLEILTFTAVALMLSSFFLAHEQIAKQNLQIVWWLPLLVAICGAAMSLSYVNGCYRVGNYIKQIEDKVAWPDHGWEHFLEKERSEGHDVISWRTRIIWVFTGLILGFVGMKFCGWTGIMQLVK